MQMYCEDPVQLKQRVTELQAPQANPFMSLHWCFSSKVLPLPSLATSTINR